MVTTVEFKKFLDENSAWKMMTEDIQKKGVKKFNRNIRTLQRWRENLRDGRNITSSKNKQKYQGLIDLKNYCYFCDAKKNLNIHHIDLDNKNNVRRNLVTLCRRCHRRLHGLVKRDFLVKRHH